MSIGSMIDELYGTRKKLTIICDIDNTIADTIDRINAITELFSLTHLEKWGPEQVEMFTRQEYIDCDEVVAGAEILPSLLKSLDAQITFITGRGSQSREATENWIWKNFPTLNGSPVLMREDGGYDNTAEYKFNVFKEKVYSPNSSYIFFDDDEDLLEKYAQYGLAMRAPECWKAMRIK